MFSLKRKVAVLIVAVGSLVGAAAVSAAPRPTKPVVVTPVVSPVEAPVGTPVPPGYETNGTRWL